MKKSKQALGIYVELDALQDTRAGTLNKIDPVLAKKAIGNGYHTRTRDKFEGFDTELFNQLYKERDKETLFHSAPAECILFVREIVGAIEKSIKEANSPIRGEIKIDVNLYPYQLTEEEISIIGKALVLNLGISVPLELVYIKPEELSIDLVRQRYAYLVMYDFDPWMSLHFNLQNPEKYSMKELVGRTLLDVTLYSAAIERGPEPTEQERTKGLKDIGNPLLITETTARTLIGLQLLDVAFFSVLRPRAQRA